MMQQYRSNSYLFGGNAPYVEELYEAYLDNPGSVPDNWRTYFDALQHVPAVDGTETRDVAHAPVVESFAQRIAAIGRLPLLGALADSAPPLYVDPEDESEPEPPNSAQRLAEVYGRLSVPGGLEGLDNGPVLLIDDVSDSGWTLTVAAMLLRRAGAPAVLPLTLTTTN